MKSSETIDRRVRTGCKTCLKRRVKCDEAKPFCARCRTANFLCQGYRPPRQASPDGPPLSFPTSDLGRVPSPHQESPNSELSWRHENWRQEELPLYHHFVTTSVVRLFRSDHVSFWRDQVAQMSFGLDIVYEALLAIGAVHRASLLACQYGNFEEASRSKLFGLRAYGKALRLLHNHLGQEKVSEPFPILIVLVLLTYFECFQENPKGAFQHLWAAIQHLRRLEDGLSDNDVSNMVPLFDAMLRLDFLAQKMVPYACSSFSRCSDLAIMEKPFWNRPSPKFSKSIQPDPIAAERYLLIQLVGGYNNLSRIIWGSWCPTSERPSRDELMGFYSEMLLWKANSPATFARCDGLDSIEVLESMPFDQRPIPPPACQLLSSEMALNIMMYNAYLGCAIAMISTTDENPAARESEAFNLVYQGLCITAGQIENDSKQSGSPYKPCDAINTGISIYLYHALRRCFSPAWQEWAIAALRSIGREGLSNGFTGANTLEIMCRLESKMQHRDKTWPASTGYSPLGHIRDRLIPLLLPRGDDDQNLAFYLRYGNAEVDGDERAIQVVAKATWKQDALGTMRGLKLDVYESAIDGYSHLRDRPEAIELFRSWRQEVEKGWHGYLTTEVQEGFLQKEGLHSIS